MNGRRAPRLARLGTILVAVLCGAPTAARAQDVEMASRLGGRPLPPAYYERVRARPDFFETDRGWSARLREAAAGAAVTGTLRLAVVLALFADSPEPGVSAEEMQRVLFDGPNPDGTVTDFYAEDSGGRFTVTGTALPWVRTGITRAAAVGTSFGLGSDAGTAAYLTEAVAAADTLTDFGAFDNDGPDGVPNSGDDDGFVDALAFHFIEVSASCGGNGIWPHRSTLTRWTGAPVTTQDERPDGSNIQIDSYIIQSAVTCAGDETATISTITHELGHVLGLPDYYDATEGILPEQRRWVMGCWSLMAAGAWGCNTVDRNTVRRPTHMGPWEKLQLGWLDEITEVGAVRNQEFALEPILAANRILRVPLNGDDEFLLVEYRTQEGFDEGLPASGVLVYHIEPSRPRRPCLECAKIYEAALIEADGDRALVKLAADGGDRGSPGDAFARTGPQRLTNGTTPSVRLNAGGNSAVTFHRIAVEDGVARLVVSTTAIDTDRLLAPFLQALDDPLTDEDRRYLDAIGNGNGRYDVGDLRAYLRDFPADGR